MTTAAYGEQPYDDIGLRYANPRGAGAFAFFIWQLYAFASLAT